MRTLDYPLSLKENQSFRNRLYESCASDPVLAAEIKAICAADILTWINLFCYTKDPRRKPDILPFICYSFQKEAIVEIQSAIRNQYDLLMEKSRDVGASWMILYVFTHFWLFEKGSDFRIGSRKEDFVDKLNDIDTLLEKIRFNLKKQPLFLLPVGFMPEDHCAYMRIMNPENGNAIIGESANPSFGSGGRRKAVLLDEFAKWDDSVAEAAWTSTADVSPCRIVVSTPVGSANKFAQLANGSKEKIKKLTFHWTLHPDKVKGAYYIDNGVQMPIESPEKAFTMWRQGIRVRSSWYDAEAERRSESDLAQEVDIDYLQSGHPFFSLLALSKQKVWKYIERKLPTDLIPHGFFIKAKPVEIDNKIELRESIDGWLRVYELPQKGYQYVVGADVSEGLAKGDESFAVVRDKATRNVVACVNGLYPPDDFAVKLYKIAQFYNKADLAPENNNHGFSVCSDLKKMDCNLYQSKRIGVDGKETVVKAGWTTDARSRPAMLDQLEEEIRKDAIELRDEVLISQAKTFVNNARNGRPEAEGAFHDDGIMACAIGSAVIKERPFKPKAIFDAKRAQLVAAAKRPLFRFR